MAIQNDGGVAFLRSRRVILRPPTKEDIPHFLRWMNDPEVVQYLAAYLPFLEADETDWLERLHKEKDRHAAFVILDAKDGKPIGDMGIFDIAWKDRRATTGALIGEKAYWGKGYGSEAKMLLLNYAFNTLNLRKMTARLLACNTRSQRYCEKCGYKTEGTLKQEIFKNGQYHDVLLMAVFKEDWLPLWEKFRKANTI